MAVGKYTRIDNNKRSSSSYCSSVTIVVFVALCLVGVWMMTSSSVVPAQNVDVAQESKNEVKEQSDLKEQVTETNNGNTRQFEDNPGDLPEDATKGENGVTSENNSNMQEKQEEKLEDKPEEKSSEDAKTEDGDKKTEEKDSLTENTESNSESTEKKDSDETKSKGDSEETSLKKSDSDESEKKSDSDESEKKSELDESEKKSESDESEQSDTDESAKKSDDSSETTDNKTEEKVEQSDNKESDESSNVNKADDSANNQSSIEVYPSGAQSELLNESTTQNGSFSTQAAESKNEKESRESSKQSTGYNWKLCNVTAGPDYIPCLDNLKAIRKLPSTKHYEHRERQCPEEPPTCLVSLPEGYRRPITWPKSREKVQSTQLQSISIIGLKGYSLQKQ